MLSVAKKHKNLQDEHENSMTPAILTIRGDLLFYG